MRLGRRGPLLGAVALSAIAALTLAGCAGASTSTDDSADGGESTELRTINVSAPPSYNALALHVADAEGYFAEEGLELEISTVVGGEAVPALIGGNLDFILNDMVTLTTARSQGLPLVIAVPNTLLDPPGDTAYVNVLIRKEDAAKYSSVADISGQKFGIPTVNSQPWLDIRSAVSDAGGDAEAIEFVQVPDPLQALRDKTVEFVTAPNPAAAAAELSDDLAILAPLTSVELGGIVGYPYLTTETLLESEPELVEAFQRAMLKASALINSDRALALEVAATYLEFPAEVLDASTLPLLGEVQPTEAELQKVIDRIVKNGIVPADKAPAPADLLP